MAPGTSPRPTTEHDQAADFSTESDSLVDDLFNVVSGGGMEVRVPAQQPGAPAAAPPSPAVAAPGAAPPVVAPPASAPGAATTAAAPGAEQPGGQPGPTQASPPPSAADPRGLADSIQQNESALVNEIAKTYQFTPEEVEALGLDPDAAPAFQHLMAKVQVRTMTNAMRFIAESVPKMFQRMNAIQTSLNESENMFFSRWPDIPRDKTAQVQQWAKMFRQMNPTMPREQMIEELGEMAMRTFKITPRNQAAPAAPASNGVHGQPRPVAPQGARPVAVFQPAQPGTAGPSPTPEDPGANWQWLSPNFPTG